jgi:hypothetical protein
MVDVVEKLIVHCNRQEDYMISYLQEEFTVTSGIIMAKGEVIAMGILVAFIVIGFIYCKVNRISFF